MACRSFGNAIVCGPVARCKDCHAPSTILCDFPVIRLGKEHTCDRRCCRNHAVRVGENKDFCLPHARFALKEKANV